MNGAHIHLLLNHFPVIGLFFSTLILGLGFFRPNQGFIRAGLLVAMLAGALAVPTFFSGESAEEVIENSVEFQKDLLEEHEEAAEFAVWAMVATAVAAAAGLFSSIQKNRIPKPLMIGIFVLNLFSLAVVARTNNLGGQISHPEIRDSNTSNQKN